MGRAGGILTSQLVDAPGFKRGREPPARHGYPDGCRSFECAQLSVIEACATTQVEDAAFGIAWHGQMHVWVLALMAADGKAFQ